MNSPHNSVAQVMVMGQGVGIKLIQLLSREPFPRIYEFPYPGIYRSLIIKINSKEHSKKKHSYSNHEERDEHQ